MRIFLATEATIGISADPARWKGLCVCVCVCVYMQETDTHIHREKESNKERASE